MKILWVKAGKLLPLDAGGKIRSYHILRHLSRGHDVTLLSYYSGQRDLDYEGKIESDFPGTCSTHVGALDGSPLLQSLDYLHRFFDRATPFAVSKFTHDKVQQLVKSWTDGAQFDVCVCDFLSASRNFPDRLATPTILFQHNVETTLWERMASMESHPIKRLIYRIEAAKMSRYEREALGRFQHVIAVSDHDRIQMLEMDPSCRISVVPTGVDAQRYTAAPHASADPPRIVFTGSMDWEPNIDAVVYFCQTVFPQIRKELPNAIFLAVGRNPHSHVRRLASDSVQVTGTVTSIADYLRDATLVVVPLRIGGGTRLKIFEAMAMGKAVVSTTVGAEGLDVESGRDLILADDAKVFADAVLMLVKNDTLRRQYELAARRLAAQHDWSKVAGFFADALQKVLQEARPDTTAVSRTP